MRQAVVLSALVALAAVLAGPSVAYAADDGDIFGGTTSGTGDEYEVHGSRTGGRSSGGSGHPASDSGGGPPTQYVRAPGCLSLTTRSDLTPTCPNDDPIVEVCLDGSNAIEPLWARTQNADGSWTEWSAVSWYYCPNNAPLLAAIQHEWTQLKPQPSDIALQPDTGWVLATVPTVAMANDAPRIHATTLLGAAVEIRAIASGYRWQWGDGSATTTTDPGQPYPNATLTHTYPHASDEATVGLTTTWAGEYRINGGEWVDFASTISSDSTPVALQIYDPRSRLVDCDLEGQCRIEARG